MKQRNRYGRIELAIALTLFFVLCYAAFCDTAQQQLSDDVLRLRVVANSDTEEDQRIKLYVRDRLLSEIQPLQQQAHSREHMRQLLRAHMQQLTNAAQQAVYEGGGTQRVTASLATEWYPTRQYDTFALPAGEYTGLQVKIGASQGHNWWCVLYPALCVDAAAKNVLSADEQALVERDGAVYALRFRTAELLGELRELWND